MPKKAKDTKPEPYTFEKLKEMYLDCRRAQVGWRQKARDWFAMDSGKQWSDEDQQVMEDQKRPIVTFNRMAAQIDAVCGLEVNNRRETSYQPRVMGAIKRNEVLSSANKYIRDNCNAEDEESQMFRDSLVCGLGATETYMDYDSNPQGDVIISRVDAANELYWDHKARKVNFSDIRYLFRTRRIHKDEAKYMFEGMDEAEIDASWSQPDRLQGPSHETTPVGDYGKEGTLPYDSTKREVVVVEAQWFERQDVYYITDPFTGQNKTIEKDEFEILEKRMDVLQETWNLEEHEGNPAPQLDWVKQKKKVYKRAFLGKTGFIDKHKGRGDAPCKDTFTYKFMTFKIDRNTGEPYGLAKPLEDPQKWANKWLAQTMYLLNANPKGGVFAEEDAVENWSQFESSYADPAMVTKVRPGSLAAGKLQPKTPPQLPTAMPALLEFAINSFPQVTGINLDAIGLADRNQPGVLEHMRKQSMMTILAGVFGNLRKYRKEQGKLELHFIREFISDGRLIKVGDGHLAKYVQLVRDQETEDYEVVVDESPTSPNQKDQTWLIISQMLPLLQKLPVPPEMWLKVIEYSPLPSSLSDDLVEIMTKAMQSAGTKPIPFKPTVSVDKMLDGLLTPNERNQLLMKIGITPEGQQPQQQPPQGGMPPQLPPGMQRPQ